MEPSLITIQKRLWKLITAPELPSATLSVLAKKKLPIIPGRHLKPVERLDIYANMYFFRILEALGEDFPGVVKMMGHARFHNLVTSYLIKHPSKHFSLRMMGRHLPSFLKKHPLIKKWPSLWDLAALEWALLSVFDAEDAQPLTLEILKKIQPEKWATIPLQLIAGHSLLTLNYRVDLSRDKLLKNKETKIKKESILLLVWRKGFKVFYRPIGNLESKLLKKLVQGTTLETLGEIAARYSGQEQGSIELAGLFNRWMGDALIYSLDCV